MQTDEAIGWDDWGWEDQTGTLLPPGDYDGTITAAQWATADWVKRKYPDQNPDGVVLRLKIEIDNQAGYAEVWRDIPRHMRGAIVAACKAAGVEPPVKGGPAWSPVLLHGRAVRIETSIYTNPKTDESKVQVESWIMPDEFQAASPEPAKRDLESEVKKTSKARKTKAAAAESAPGATRDDDDIPF